MSVLRIALRRTRVPDSHSLPATPPPDAGDALNRTAEELLAQGRVTDVRILQGGKVITGVIAPGAEMSARTGTATGERSRQRVYIRHPGASLTTATHAHRMQSLSTQALQVECSCGAGNPGGAGGHCAHVIAVSIAAERSIEPGLASRDSTPLSIPRTSVAAVRNATAAQQRLYYLIESDTLEDQCDSRGATGNLRLSIWVGQSTAGGHTMEPGSAQPFTARSSNGAHPRYVDEQDKEVLQLLAESATDGTMSLSGEAGTRLLRKIVATGRGCWRSLETPALSWSSPRNAEFSWETLPNGTQQLRCDLEGVARISLEVEPFLYMDAAAARCGIVGLAAPVALLRQYWNHPPVTPEQVAGMNEQAARDLGAQFPQFPKLRELAVRRQSRVSLRPRLRLSAGPKAELEFIYNDLAVPAASLPPQQEFVRILSDAPHADGSGATTVAEIARDHVAEQQFSAQLQQSLPGPRHDADTWLAFMMRQAPALRAMGWDIAVQESFPFRLAIPQDWYADLAAQRDRPWFDLKLGLVVDGQQVNLLPALLGHLQATLGNDDNPTRSLGGPCQVDGHWLIPLPDGRYLPLPVDRIQRIADTLIELLERDALDDQGALALPRSQASRVAQLMHGSDSPALRSDDASLLTLVEGLAGFSGITPLDAPVRFKAQLRPYQREGLGWLQFLRRYRLGGILADDMGLGKTVQTLAHLVLEHDQGRLTRPALIVAPVSVIGNWQRELTQLAPHLKVLVLHGAKRRESFPAVGQAQVVITGYPLLQIDSEFLLTQHFSFLILDEAQTIKNPRAAVSRAACALRADHRLCLTGTPMENHLGELWSLFDFAQHGLLGTETQFQRQYRFPIERNASTQRSAALSRRIAPFVLRRTKDVVARDLPPKTQIVESLVLDERQRDFYDGIRLSMHQRVREIVQQQGLARSQIIVLDALLKLRQVCCDPRLIDDAEARHVPSAKLEWLQTVLPELVAEGRRILLFSQFTSMLRLIEPVVAELDIPYLMLTGATRERAALVERFQTGQAPLFLISLKAGGTGLNLTAADTVIHYDPWWNPAVEAQATDRAHRIGQDKPVFVYKLITQGTVEERILQLQADKHALANQLYTRQNASPLQLTAADLEALLAP